MNIHYDPQPVDVLYIDVDTEEVSNNIYITDSIVVEKGINTNLLTGFKFLCFEEIDVVKELFDAQGYGSFEKHEKTYITKNDVAVLTSLTNMIVKNWETLKEVL